MQEIAATRQLQLDVPEHAHTAGLPAFARVATLLRENIINGNLIAGQPLAETELAERCGSSRNTCGKHCAFCTPKGW